VLPHYSPIKEQYPGEHDVNTKPSEEEVCRNEIAKANLLKITHSRKTCSRCLICNLSTLTRKEALLHLKTSHLETNAAHTKLPRIHLHCKKTCTNCKRNDSSTLINLTCLNELCESCLLDFAHANEIEERDHVGYFSFHIHCPFAIINIGWTLKQPSFTMNYVIFQFRLLKNS